MVLLRRAAVSEVMSPGDTSNPDCPQVPLRSPGAWVRRSRLEHTFEPADGGGHHDDRRAARTCVVSRRPALADLDRAIDGLTAVRAAVLVAERESGTWQGGGDRSFESWRSRVARTTAGSARTQVREAEQLHAVPAVLDAVTAGRITMSHATALARVAGSGTPAQRGAVLDQVAQEGLLELAERTDAGTFATAVARWAATVDLAGVERDHQAQRAERFLHLSETPSGAFVKGRLDSMAGHRLALALEALTPRPAADDDRDPGQRRADALDTMVGRILADADTKPGGHVPPHVSMIVSAETWDAARAERDRRRAALGAARDTPTSWGGHPPRRRPRYLDAARADALPRRPRRLGPVRARAVRRRSLGAPSGDTRGRQTGPAQRPRGGDVRLRHHPHRGRRCGRASGPRSDRPGLLRSAAPRRHRPRP